MTDVPAQPVVTNIAGNDFTGVYTVIRDTLAVYYGNRIKTAELNGSNPEPLAEILLHALLSEMAANGVVLDEG